MKKGQDIFIDLNGIKIIHQKIPGRELGDHKHPEHEFFLPIAGEITITHEGKKYTAGPGKMLYVPPHIQHNFSSSTGGTGERVIWMIENNLWRKHLSKDYPILLFPINTLVKEILFYLLLRPKVKGEKYFICALIESLRDSMEYADLRGAHLELNHLPGKIEDKRVVKSMLFLNGHLGESSLARVAKDCGMSVRNFNRIFLKEAGLTPKEYLQMKRIEKARELLLQSNKTITDISFEVGFNSVSKFIAAFKKIEGKLPSDFRSEFIY